jgi:hypothetical protein
MADKIERRGTFEGMCIACYAVLVSHCRYYKDGAKIVRELINKESISEDTYHSLVCRDTGNKLLEINIFAYHFNSGGDYLLGDIDETVLRGKFGSLGRKMNKSSPSDYQLTHRGSKPLQLGARAQSGDAHG